MKSWSDMQEVIEDKVKQTLSASKAIRALKRENTFNPEYYTKKRIKPHRAHPRGQNEPVLETAALMTMPSDVEMR